MPTVSHPSAQGWVKELRARISPAPAASRNQFTKWLASSHQTTVS